MGDIVPSMEGDKVTLQGFFSGTAPLERLDIRNGRKTIRSIRPFSKDALGNRIKVIWSGAEVKGRARMVPWDGSLTVRGNRILSFRPVNFWSPDQAPERKGNTIQWQSATTGGLAGLILELEHMRAGFIDMKTAQGKTSIKIGDIGLRPRTRNYGGLQKQIRFYRLPTRNPVLHQAFQLPVRALHSGDNPLYIRAYQEDGHIAWSSPIYVINGTAAK